LSTTKRLLFLALAVVILLFFVLTNAPAGLEQSGYVSFGLLIFTIILWLGNVMPKSVVALLIMILMPILGVTESMSIVYQDFISSIFFFLLAAFAIGAMVKSSDVPNRLMAFFLKIFHANSKLIILAFMLSAAIVSAIMSDLAACALFASIVYAVFKDYPYASSKNTIKCVMMAVPMGSLAGGIMTPIGSPVNITMMELLSQSAGISVSFVQWMTLGIPVALIAVILSWLALIITFKPEDIDVEIYSTMQEKFNSLEKLSIREIKILTLVGILFLFWVMGAWFPQIDTTMVAIGGLVAMFLPKVDLITWDEFQKQVPWDLVIMLSGLMALAQSLLKTGAINWFIDTVLSGVVAWNPFVVLFVCTLAVALLRAFLPNGPPIVVMATPAFVKLALAVELHPLCVIILLSTWCQITYLIPAIDAAWLITYSKGYYTITDVQRFGIGLTCLLLLIYSFFVPAWVGLLGL
jgi:sodium-dependent dicarboxylate transporter 2/3/5